MIHWSEWLAFWLGELFWHSTVLLAAVSLLLPWIRQPARRMTVCRGSFSALFVLIVLPSSVRDRAVIRLPDWVHVTWHQSEVAHFPAQVKDRESEILIRSERERPPTRFENLDQTNKQMPNESDTASNREFSEFQVAAGDSDAGKTEAASLSPLLVRNSLLSSDSSNVSGVSSVPDTRVVNWTFIASAIWVGGAMLATIWIAVGGWRTQRLFQRSRGAPAWIHHELRSVVPEHRRLPRLRVNDRIESALACGAMRPAILVPECKARTPERGQPPEGGTPTIRAALAHEWAHIANGDLWQLAAERLLLPIYFAQPLFWLLRRRIRIDQDLLADAAAARQSPVEYAEALLAWAKSTLGGPRDEALAVLSFWNNPCQLSRRIEMLLDTENRIVPRASRLWRGTTLAIVFAVACGLSLITLGTADSVAQNQSVGPAKSNDGSDDVKTNNGPAATDTAGDVVRATTPAGTSPNEAAVNADLARAKAVLAIEQTKSAESSEIEELRRVVKELQNEIRGLRQKLPPEESLAPAKTDRQGPARNDGAGAMPAQIEKVRKSVDAMTTEIRDQRERSSKSVAAAANDDRAIEIQLLELDVNEAGVDVAAAKSSYDEATNLSAKGVVGTSELNARKVALQKAEIALQRAKLRLAAAKRQAPKSTDKPMPEMPKPQAERGDKPSAEAPHTLTIAIAASADGEVVSLSVGPAKLLEGPLDQEKLLQLKHDLQRIFASTTKGYDAVILQASPTAKPNDLKEIARICITQISPDGRRVKDVEVVVPPNPEQAAEKPGANSGHEHDLTITITAAADGQVASLSVGLAKLFDGPLDDQRLTMLDRRLKDVLAIEGKPYDRVLLRAHRNLKFEELIKVADVCTKQKSADGQPIKKLSFEELAPNPDKPGDDGAGMPEGSSRIPVLSDLSIVGPLFDKQKSADESKPRLPDDSQAVTPNRKLPGNALHGMAQPAPERKFMVRGLTDALALLAPVTQQHFSHDEENRVLDRWSAATANIRRLETEFTRFVYDAGSQIETRSEGVLTLESPFRAAYVLLPTNVSGHISKKIGNNRRPFTLQTEDHEHGWIWAEREIIHVDLKSETYTSSPIALEDSMASVGSEFLLAKPFLLGMPTGELREQFDVALIKKTADELWLSFVPRQPQRRQSFSRAVLILNSQNFFPKGLKLTEGSQVESVHLFRSFKLNGPPSPGVNFAIPDLPGAGYKAVVLPQAGDSSTSATIAKSAILPSLVDETAALVKRRLGLAVAAEPVSKSALQSGERHRGGLKVVSVESDGPAEAAGIRADDILVGIHAWEMVRHDDLKFALTHWQLNSNNQKPADKQGRMRLFLMRGAEAFFADLEPRP